MVTFFKGELLKSFSGSKKIDDIEKHINLYNVASRVLIILLSVPYIGKYYSCTLIALQFIT